MTTIPDFKRPLSVRNVALAFILAFATFTSPQVLHAVKASPEPFMWQQPDGSTIQVRLTGNEDFHFYIDAAGRRLLPDAAGRLVEAEAEAVETHRKSPMRVAGLSHTYPSVGEAKALVVLVEFSDRDMRNTGDSFRRMLNEPGYSDFGADGSARDYFIDNSFGIFRPQFDVYGPVKLAHPASYYSANNDALAHEMGAEALRALDSTVDFSDYDMDKDGWIDNIYIFYAGYGRADGGGVNTVWPHTSNIYSKGVRLTLDGVMAGSYSCSNELRGGTQSMVGIGTFCHEFCHVLGLPDIYATNEAEVPSPGYWSVMDHGNYCNNGRTPVSLSAYEREFLGWCNPLYIDRDASLRIDAGSPLAYKLADSADSDEYFLLECRAKRGWDAYLPGEGLAVWHIDYDRTAWDTNSVNNDPSHQRIDLVEADGVHSTNGDAGDTFPGTRNISSVTLTSRNGTVMTPSLSDISYTAGTVYLCAGSASTIPAAPTSVTVNKISDSGAAVTWDAVADADAYYVTVTDRSDNLLIPATGLHFKRTDSTKLILSGLQPDSEYEVAVRACKGISVGSESEHAQFTTDHPGLAFFAPEIIETTDITENSFTAHWQEMELASSYSITVSELQQGKQQTDVASFGEGNFPEDWLTNSSETISIAGYYGEAAPALRLSEPSSFVQTGESSQPMQSLSFWLRGYRNDSEARLLVKALVDGSWQTIDRIAPSRTEGALHTYSPTGATAARLEWDDPNNSGSACIDDVTVALPGEMQFVTILDGIDTNGETFHKVSGLSKSTTYRYFVQGTNGEILSQPSEEVEVRTLENSSSLISAMGDTLSVSRDGQSIQATAPGLKITILDLSGRQAATGTGSVQTSLPKGIYIIKAGNSTLKLTI